MEAEDGETYRLMARGDGYRIGLAVGPGTAAPPAVTIELLVRLFRTGGPVGAREMERASQIVRALTGMGYRVVFQEDGWVSCERDVGGADAEAEARLLQEVVGGW